LDKRDKRKWIVHGIGRRLDDRKRKLFEIASENGVKVAKRQEKN
jgi:hypothetical protein